MTSPSLSLIVVAAGSSRRMAGTDKIWAPLGGRSVLWHATRRLAAAASAVVVVARPDSLDRACAELRDVPGSTVVAGGPERQDSVFLGLQALPAAEHVAVHDAARPLACVDDLHRARELLASHDGAIPALAISDTVKEVDDDGRVTATLERGRLRAVQTPQVFRWEVLWQAHLLARRKGWHATDDAQLIERSGGSIVTFPGSPRNIKITTEFDLTLARRLLGEE